MPSRYCLLKCVASAETSWAKPTRALRLTELKVVVAGDAELQWGLNPQGVIHIRNPDGSVVSLQPHSGFAFRARPASFFICYECCEGIAIHTERDPDAHRKVAGFAKQLNARIFEL